LLNSKIFLTRPRNHRLSSPPWLDQFVLWFFEDPWIKAADQEAIFRFLLDQVNREGPTGGLCVRLYRRARQTSQSKLSL
jgi:hypothetical protein